MEQVKQDGQRARWLAIAAGLEELHRYVRSPDGPLPDIVDRTPTSGLLVAGKIRAACARPGRLGWWWASRGFSYYADRAVWLIWRQYICDNDGVYEESEAGRRLTEMMDNLKREIREMSGPAHQGQGQ